MGEPEDMLKQQSSLGGWHQRPQGPCRGVTLEVGTLVHHHLQQEAGVAGQHILGLLEGQLVMGQLVVGQLVSCQLVACQLPPPDGSLLCSRSHSCHHRRQ